MHKKDSLKKIIKPLIKECLTEILYEQGLNKLIEESIKTKQREVVQESKEIAQPQEDIKTARQKFMGMIPQEQKKTSLQEGRRQLLEKIGKGGFDPFEGSIPEEKDEDGQLAESIVPEASVLPGIKGKGIDISSLLGSNKEIWKTFTTAFNEKGKKE